MLKMKRVMIAMLLVFTMLPVVSVHAQTTNPEIDPSEDERPVPGIWTPGKPRFTMTDSSDSLGQWDTTVNSETQIDPEREYPILGKNKPNILNIDPEREYPILGKKGILTLIESARVLTEDPDLQMHAAQITFSAVAASMFITLYRFASLGGRQKVLAAIIPPGVILDQFGQSGYKVPAHSVYTPEDAMTVAKQLSTLSPAEAEAYVKTLDAELIEYFSTVVYYIRSAKAKEMSEWCPNIDLCA